MNVTLCISTHIERFIHTHTHTHAGAGANLFVMYAHTHSPTHTIRMHMHMHMRTHPNTRAHGTCESLCWLHGTVLFHCYLSPLLYVWCLLLYNTHPPHFICVCACMGETKHPEVDPVCGDWQRQFFWGGS